MKKVPVLFMLLTLIASGAYVFVYLNRWEWTRALFVGMVFIVAEIALVGWLVFQKLDRLNTRIESQTDITEIFDAGTLMQIRQAQPEYDRFGWMREKMRDEMSRTNVFITMVVGGGVVLSGLAWIVDKVAARTVVPNQERALAADMHTIAFPSGHLIAEESSLIAQHLPDVDDPDLRLLVGDTRAVTA